MPPAVWEAKLSGFQKCLSQDSVYGLLDWADTVGSGQVAQLCGTFLGVHSAKTGGTNFAFAAAMSAYNSRTLSCRVDLPFSGQVSGASPCLC